MRVHAQSVYTICTILQPKLPKYLLITLVTYRTLPVQEKREKYTDQNKNKKTRKNSRQAPVLDQEYLSSRSTRPELVLLILALPPAALR